MGKRVTIGLMAVRPLANGLPVSAECDCSKISDYESESMYWYDSEVVPVPCACPELTSAITQQATTSLVTLTEQTVRTTIKTTTIKVCIIYY